MQIDENQGVTAILFAHLGSIHYLLSIASLTVPSINGCAGDLRMHEIFDSVLPYSFCAVCFQNCDLAAVLELENRIAVTRIAA